MCIRDSNNDYGRDLFPIVEPLIFGPATRVMSLRDGKKKMSKSDVSDYSRVNLADDADTIALKIRKAKTDPDVLPATPEGLAGRPEAANLLGIYAALADSDIEATCARFAGQTFAAFKSELGELAAEMLGRIGAEMRRLEADPGYIEALLTDGAERAEAMARPVVREVYDAVGFLPAGPQQP